MDVQAIEQRANELKNQLDGKIFAFPVNEQDPFSKYAVTIFTGGGFHTFPELLTIEEAAAGVKETLQGFAEEGLDADYERNVRFASYDAQINAPSVTMRRLKNGYTRTGYLKQGVDITPTDDGDYHFSARGLIKFSYLQMIDDDLPKAAQFMNEYYRLLAMSRYGKTASAIKQEVRKMSKDQAIKWIEQSYTRYIRDDMAIMDIMNLLRA